MGSPYLICGCLRKTKIMNFVLFDQICNSTDCILNWDLWIQTPRLIKINIV